MDLSHDLTIQTARLVIRPWERADLMAYARWRPFTEPLLVAFNNGPRNELEADFTWAMEQHTPQRRHWTIVSQTAVVGRISLSRIDLVKGSGELGILLGSAFVGQGMGTEALRGWIDAAFTRWQMQTLSLQVACWNQRARRLYEKLGFVQVGSNWRPVDDVFPHEATDLPGDCLRQGVGVVAVRWHVMELEASRWQTDGM